MSQWSRPLETHLLDGFLSPEERLYAASPPNLQSFSFFTPQRSANVQREERGDAAAVLQGRVLFRKGAKRVRVRGGEEDIR